MKTLVLGASVKPHRYSYMAAHRLQAAGIDYELVGRRQGELFGKLIHDIKERPTFDDIHTITLYIGTNNLPEWFDYIMELDPIRIIFNPGTENMELAEMARQRGVDVEFGCTLTMLSVGTY